MANHDREWARNRYGDDDRGWRGEDVRERNRGMFGYEGEGYLRGTADRDRGGDERGYDRGYRGSGYMGGAYSGGTSGPRGYRDLEEPRGGYADFNRGDYNRGDFDRGNRLSGGGYGPSYGSDSGPAARPSYRGRGPKNYQRSDDRIREDVCERLELDHDVDASDIEVTVSGGTVTLAGSVSDRVTKRRAEDIVESVKGVRDVQNNIRIGREDTQTTA